MKYSFHPDAEIEFLNAVDYYEEIEQGLGLDFANEIYSAINRAYDMPDAWTSFNGPIRRSLAKRFPYGVLYIFEDDKIFIIAVMHLHRDPDYWTNRI